MFKVKLGNDDFYAKFDDNEILINRDYTFLNNKPHINGVELMGNKSFEDLGEETITNEEIENITNQAYSNIFGGN